ncbi:MAG TPA: nucleoside hydrolase-like domain-containing protein, partial [Anaerolineae bacterium]|nr:nucleoside hydrolase-like domain-containing protein [Anaerolineae bacterium]
MTVTADSLSALGHPARPRLIVTTDISTLTADQGEPDDTQSLVRLLLYSCDVEIEGLIASSTMAKGRVVHGEYIRAVVHAYGQVRDRLREHSPAFPSEEELQALVKGGNGDYGMDHVGEGQDSEASDWII